MSAVARPWAGLTVLAVAVFCVITTEVVPVGLLPLVVADFGIDEAQAGMLVSVYAALVAITAVPLTLATRRISRRFLLVATLVVFTIANVLAAAAPGFAVLLAARMLGGLAHALFFAIAIGYAARIAPAGQIGRAIAFTATGTSAGLIVGVPAGTTLGGILGWRSTLLVLGALTAIAAIAAIALLPAIRHDATAARTLLPGGPRLLLVASLAGAVFLGHYALYTYVSGVFLGAGLDPSALGVALAALGVAALVGIRIAARRLDAHPYRWMVAVPAAICVTQVALVAVYPMLWPVLVVAALWTGSFGPVNATYQNVLVRIGRDAPDMAGAWINVTCNIGIGAGTALGGAVVTASGYAAAGTVGAGVLAAVVAVTIVCGRTLRAA